MQQSTAQRKLVKSPPELWAEVSSEDALGRHLASFGEIRITRVEPETTVAWEGDRASGTVELEASEWGTKVILSAMPAQEQEDSEPTPVQSVQSSCTPPPHAEPAVSPAAEQERKCGFFARLFRRRATPSPDPGPPALGPDPPPPDPDPAPTLRKPLPAPAPALDTDAILAEVLDGLGAAHHRPFSRG